MTETTDTIQSFAAYPTASGGVPIGTILPYGGPVSGSSQGTLETQGYLFCDGTAISRSDYSALFSVIGNAFGAGNNVDTFNLPDLRGLFLRGVDGGSGKDPDTNSRTAFAPQAHQGCLSSDQTCGDDS
jgi:phage-related tail fiber protein